MRSIEHLTDEWLTLWLTEGRAWPTRPVSLVEQFHIEGVRYWLRIDDGRIVDGAMGETRKPNIIWRYSREIAARIERGETTLGDQIAAGTVQVEGDAYALSALDLLTPSYETSRHGIAASVVY